MTWFSEYQPAFTKSANPNLRTYSFRLKTFFFHHSSLLPPISVCPYNALTLQGEISEAGSYYMDTPAWQFWWFVEEPGDYWGYPSCVHPRPRNGLMLHIMVPRLDKPLWADFQRPRITQRFRCRTSIAVKHLKAASRAGAVLSIGLYFLLFVFP